MNDSVAHLVQTLAILAVVLVIIWRLDRLASSFMGLAQKLLELRETQILRPVSQTEPMPPDLWNFAHQEGEEWAREQMLKHIREQHDELGDWNLVRKALTNGKVTDDSTE